ncbi:MAG: hypothetical protein AB4041_14030 [Microcystaceae cyanobacterium]
MSSSPYQSRLLSFLNRQSLRWRDRFGKTSRRLKVAAEWGVQMLVYPIYVLVQTGRLFGTKIDQSAVNPQLSSSPTDLDQDIPSDQPIEEILTFVDPWVMKNEQTLSSAATPTVEQLSTEIQQRVQTVLTTRQRSNVLSQVTHQLQKAIVGNNQGKLKLQGVATELEGQKLVLVANNNQTFDLLTDEQEVLLDKRIRRELGNYYYEKRLYRLVGRTFPSLIPQFTEKDENVLPPIRWFWKTMRWVQTSEVAASLNFFGESELSHLPVREKRKLIWDNPEFPQGEWGERPEIKAKAIASKSPDLSPLKQLTDSARDYFYRGLQTSPLAKRQWVQQLPETSAFIQTKVKETANISQQKLLKPAKRQLKQLKQQIAQNPDDPFQLSVLIRTAIAYLLKESSLTLHPSRQNKLKSPLNEGKEPWLTPEDLFPPAVSPKSLETSSSFLPDIPPTQPIKTQVSSVTVASPTIPKVESSPQVTQVKEEALSVSNSPKKNSSSSQSIDFSPDWIETEVQTMGYVKHPLERLLKTLDQAILWLEEQLVKLVKQLVKLWKGFA